MEAVSAAAARPAIFYPVLNESYAAQIAREWSTNNGGTGYVMRFQVDGSLLNKYDVQTVGSSMHQEYWVPAAELADFKRHIVGPIEVVAVFGALSEREQES